MAQVAQRPPSRTSLRAPSPLNRSPLEDPTSPVSPPSSFSPVDLSTPQRPSRSTRRRSSYDALASLSAAKDPNVESLIPLPSRLVAEAIPEGAPIDMNGKIPATPNADGRPYTPTKGLSRIPISAVGSARALTDDGRPMSVSPLPPSINGDTSLDIGNASFTSLASLTPGTPNPNGYKRMSMGGGGTTKVLSDLQQAAVHARNALDNTRQQLRLSQRSTASLMRQVEDLKDGRERLRLENESLNNVVARKERLLQEVLERARKAEAEVLTLKTQVKAETTNAKKASSTVAEAVAQSQKAQREYTTLRDSIGDMTQNWKKEVLELKEEMRKRDDAWREEVKEVSVKYTSLVKLVKATSAERARIESLKTETVTVDNKFEVAMRDELKALRKQVVKSTEESETAGKQAEELAVELARLRRLMRTAGSSTMMQGAGSP